MNRFLEPLLILGGALVAVSAWSGGSAPDAGPYAAEAVQVATSNGVVEGVVEANGIRVFRGIPYASPPVRELRWKPPRPPEDWEGVRKADRFANQCMQARVFGDMMFRNSGMSEDCLYLNVWAPATSEGERRPVLVYFYGGGFVAGDGSEPRYDGESMAERGIVTVTLSYRLGVFGLFAHPALTQESPHGASGNYGLMDQTQALRWVQENIEAFGGDPGQVTIAGESAGSFSVSAQMATPLARGLFARAIGESGSILRPSATASLAAAEEMGSTFARGIGATTLEALRALSATELLEAASRPGTPWFPYTVDGYFMPDRPLEIYEAGDQTPVPLLVGWNSEEMSYRALLRGAEPTAENFERAVRERYGAEADAVLAVYGGSTEAEVIQAATDLAGDGFIGYSTWKWAELHRLTSGAPVYRYYYTHPRPPMRPEMGNATPGLAGGVVRGGETAAERPPAPTGAVHSAEIEYAMGNLDTNPVYAWTEADYEVSRIIQGFFANFIRTGDPNGPDLPRWPETGADPEGPVAFMRIEPEAASGVWPHRDRYLLLDRLEER
jgi:para-nitrobenzyl esterase